MAVTLRTRTRIAKNIWAHDELFTPDIAGAVGTATIGGMSDGNGDVPDRPAGGPISGGEWASADRWTSSSEQVDPSAIRSVRNPKRCDSVPHSSAAATTIRSYPSAARTTASTGSSASITRNWTGTGCAGSRKTRWTSPAALGGRAAARALDVT